MELPSIALGTWSWGSGMAGGDQVFGDIIGKCRKMHDNWSKKD